MLIYGIHTWTRCLVWPWIVVMVASMLTSLAYCIMWWAGDVRDYWLLLTIVEFFGVLINFYCFVVVCVFHCQIFELKYYEDQKKYDRFDQTRGTSQHTIEQDFDEIERPQHAELPQRSWEDFGARPIKRTYPIKMEEPIEPYSTMKSSRLQSPPLPSERRSQSAMAAMGPRSLPSVYDTVQDTSKRTRRKRSSSRRHRSTCKCYCSHHNTCYRHPHHHHHEYPSHYKHSRKHSCSSESYSTGTEQDWGAGRHKKPKPLPKYNSEGTDDSNRRRKLVGKGNYINVPARVEHPTSKHMDERLKRPAETKTALIQTDKQEPEHFLTEPAGISIPHHIFIPPPAARDGQDSQAERKYQINSEITISYDPYEQRMQRIDGQQQPLPPPKQRPKKKEVTSFASNV